MLIGGFLLLLSGGCAVLGVYFVISSIFSANNMVAADVPDAPDIGEIISISISMWPMALLTLLGLVLGWFLTKYAYRLLTKEKEKPPEDVIQPEQEVR